MVCSPTTPHHDASASASFVPTVSQDSLTLEQVLDAFLRALAGKNRAASTLRAYKTDVAQFLTWFSETNAVAQTPDQVEKADVGEYLASLAQREVSGVSRARKLAAIREYFRYLVSTDAMAHSPIEGFATPKKEKNGRVFLRTDEYTKMLSLARGSPRHYAMLQVFLKTGLRVSELCNLRVDDVDFEGRTIRITEGKGMVAREVELEKKGSSR